MLTGMSASRRAHPRELIESLKEVEAMMVCRGKEGCQTEAKELEQSGPHKPNKLAVQEATVCNVLEGRAVC